MSYTYVKEALKIFVAQTCQNIGWHAVQTSPLEIFVDVIHRYIFELCKSVHRYSTQYNRTEPNLDDLALSFKEFGIILQEIEEYVNNVEPVPFVHNVSTFPVKHPSNLQHPKPGCHELLMRPDHIPDYLPIIHPDFEEEEAAFIQHASVENFKKSASENNIEGELPSPLNSPKHGTKRSNEWTLDASNKKQRYYTEEEGRPMREVTSVFMTPSGFISPIHEGKIADATLPCLVDSPPPTPEFSSHFSKKDFKYKDAKKDKSSKIKKEKDKKDMKKMKSSKKEKENKENAIGKHDKAMMSSNLKKEHSSHKSSSKNDKNNKSDDNYRQKSKSDKLKLKSRREELRRMKDSFKPNKTKTKFKHCVMPGSSSGMKPKFSNSKKYKSVRMGKTVKNIKNEQAKIPYPEMLEFSESAKLIKESSHDYKIFHDEVNHEKVEPKCEEAVEIEELSFREESPEPRLVIDDSIETQVRQERESRLAVVDECIEAVIRRGEEESEVETEKTHKAMDETINAVVRGPSIRKLEPKDIYDFTDTSNSSSLSSCDISLESPIRTHSKKEKKSESINKLMESPKKSKNKDKKKKNKENKSKSPIDFASPRNNKNSNILNVEDRTPSPLSLKDDMLSSDDSTPHSSPNHNFFDHSQGQIHSSSMLSNIPPPPPPFVPSGVSSSAYTLNPFAPLRPLPSHMQTNPHFPTPPLFVTPSKSDSLFQNVQPLNLAKSGPASVKNSPENKPFELSFVSHNSSKGDNSEDLPSKKIQNTIEKAKSKEHYKDKEKLDRKEKTKKKIKDKKENEKIKEKKEKEEIKEKSKFKDKLKTKPEKVIKIEKRKSKLEKKKIKEDKIKEDSMVPKMTLKLSGSCSAKILLKPNTKYSISNSPSPLNPNEEENMNSPSSLSHVPTPSPPRNPTPPVRIPTPPISVSSPLPIEPAFYEENKHIIPQPPLTKTTHSRSRGRGRKSATQAVVPPARTVITETVGTIVDESGNKIWICPACSRADDGSPMIGCDECDDWYHWVCVGIVVPPKEEENWFCKRCISKRQGTNVKRRRKKHKKDK